MRLKETIVVRIHVKREVWYKVKARAALLGRPVAEYVGELLEKEVGESGGRV